MNGLEIAEVDTDHSDQPFNLLRIWRRAARDPRLEPGLNRIKDRGVVLGPVIPSGIEDDSPGHRRKARARSK